MKYSLFLFPKEKMTDIEMASTDYAIIKVGEAFVYWSDLESLPFKK